MLQERIEFQLWRPHKKSRMELIKVRFFWSGFRGPCLAASEAPQTSKRTWARLALAHFPDGGCPGIFRGSEQAEPARHRPRQPGLSGRTSFSDRSLPGHCSVTVPGTSCAALCRPFHAQIPSRILRCTFSLFTRLDPPSVPTSPSAHS